MHIQSFIDLRRQKSENRLLNGEDGRGRIVINVSGRRFETHKSTLELYPNTLLGNTKKRKRYYDKNTNEYFFDRHRLCFESILYYYQSNGRLRRPEFVPLDTFLEEVTFYELGQEALKQLRQDENIKEIRKIHLPRNHFRRHLWANMEYPQFSMLAKFINILSLIMILLSSMALAIAPYYISLVITLIRKQDEMHTNTYIELFKILRFARVFKLYRVCRGFKTLRVLASTFKESLPDFAIMLTFLTLLAFLFGAALYFAENPRTSMMFDSTSTTMSPTENSSEMFDSIPTAMYWGIITITSVGYGDLYPKTAIGRCIACLCAVFGTAVLGMLASVLVDRYQRVYTRKLYLQSEQIDFDEYSDDEEQNEKYPSQSRFDWRNDMKKHENVIQNLDPRLHEVDDDENLHTTVTDNELTKEEEAIPRTNSNVRFIIGYVDDSDEDDTQDLLEKIAQMVNSRARQDSLTIIHEETEKNNSMKFTLSPCSIESHHATEPTTFTSTSTNDQLKTGNELSSSNYSPSLRTNDYVKRTPIHHGPMTRI
ncbi:unnamed protein product [Didymodactylos carnosus]|uniref:BTB domain-containing protein n=2 Tax=Didymodactylos carnosus TaxID=1234261 RepID=A0A814SEK9_9BILA|nr:unnamed protein product [Didymodactylos carnosus]CAF3909745.1 unnamed protein product [Didymodactylos carnosus]